MTVLIVDDQPDVVRSEEQYVDWKKLGIQRLLTAFSVSEAEKLLLSESVDILLCDVEMPPRSGLELCSLIQGRRLSTRCIFLSAHAEFSYAQEAMRLGGFDYILQPAPYCEIEAAVSRAIKDIQEKGGSTPAKSSQKAPAIQPTHYAGSSEAVSQAIEYIRQNIGRDLTRMDIAKAVFLNQEYLSRLFKTETGRTLSNYIAWEKIEQAKEMLRSTDIPIGIIAQKTGYTNFSYFSQVFKRSTGLSPLEYRKSAE